MQKIILILYVVFLYFLFFIFLGLLVYNFKRIVSSLKTIPKNGVFLLLFVLIISLLLRTFIVHKVFCEEAIYINVAQNMYYHHQYGGTMQGSKYIPEKIACYNRPGGHPFLINFFYVFFGESEKTAFFMNSLWGTLSVAVIFLFTYALFNSVAIAFCTSLFVTIFPIHLVYSNSVSSEISSFFFLSLSLFILVLFIKLPETTLLYLLSATAIFSFYIRPENTLFLIPLIIFFIFLFQHGKISKKQLWNLVYFIFALALPLLTQFIDMKKIENIVARGQFWSLGLLKEQLLDNVKYLFNNIYTPCIYAIFSLPGGIFLYRTNRKIFSFFFAWFLVFFIAYSGYFAGIFSASNRYFFMCIIPLCLFAAIGVKHLLDKCGGRYKFFIYSLLLIVFVLDSSVVTKRVYGLLLHKDKEYSFLRNFSKNLPDSEYILTIEPYFVAAELNKKALDYFLFTMSNLSYKKILLLKTTGWPEEYFSKEEKRLKDSYDFKILVQKEFSPDSRTFIAELTKKNKSSVSPAYRR